MRVVEPGHIHVEEGPCFPEGDGQHRLVPVGVGGADGDVERPMKLGFALAGLWWDEVPFAGLQITEMLHFLGVDLGCGHRDLERLSVLAHPGADHHLSQRLPGGDLVTGDHHRRGHRIPAEEGTERADSGDLLDGGHLQPGADHHPRVEDRGGGHVFDLGGEHRVGESPPHQVGPADPGPAQRAGEAAGTDPAQHSVRDLVEIEDLRRGVLHHPPGFDDVSSCRPTQHWDQLGVGPGPHARQTGGDGRQGGLVRSR
jgi:hypothetical protein